MTTFSAKLKPLVNSKKNNHSALTLVADDGTDLSNWDVLKDVKDKSPVTKGEWTANRKKQGDVAKEIRIILKNKTSPQDGGFGDPPDGTLTITLTDDGGGSHSTDVPVDYANGDPLP